MTSEMYETLWGDTAPLPASAGHVDLAKPPTSYAEERAQDRERARARRKARAQAGNPMIPKHGRDADGHTCGQCLHLVRGPYHGDTYFKCKLFGMTHGPGTDYRVGWPACRKFEPRPLGMEAVIATRKLVRVPCLHEGCEQSCVVRVWYAHHECYATHPAGTTSHTVALTLAPDGTVLAARKAW